MKVERCFEVERWKGEMVKRFPKLEPLGYITASSRPTGVLAGSVTIRRGHPVGRDDTVCGLVGVVSGLCVVMWI